jgi:hypothetical protein
VKNRANRFILLMFFHPHLPEQAVEQSGYQK